MVLAAYSRFALDALQDPFRPPVCRMHFGVGLVDGKQLHTGQGLGWDCLGASFLAGLGGPCFEADRTWFRAENRHAQFLKTHRQGLRGI